MSHPALSVRIDGVPFVTLTAPREIAPRAWVLGVVAVQLVVSERRVEARVRAHLTGAAGPSVQPLSSGSILQVGLGPVGPPVARPQLTAIDAAGSAARLVAYLDGLPVGEATLASGELESTPPPRGFAHVYCRWLRDGTVEPGFDLTEIVSLPEGRKFPRLIHRSLREGQTVSYALATA